MRKKYCRNNWRSDPGGSGQPLLGGPDPGLEPLLVAVPERAAGERSSAEAGQRGGNGGSESRSWMKDGIWNKNAGRK